MSLLRKYQTGGNLKADTIINGGLVNEVPRGYKKDRQELIGDKIRTYHSVQNNEPKQNILPPSKKITPSNNISKDAVAYDKLIRNKIAGGEKIQDLVNSGVLSKESAKNYIPFQVKREVYTESKINPVQKATANFENSQTILNKSANAFRREVVEASGNGYKAYNLPDSSGNYTNNAQKVYAVGDDLIDIEKTIWDKNNKIVPYFTGKKLPTDGIVNYVKPTDDNVTKAGLKNIKTEMTVNRNNFGGNSISEKTLNAPTFKKGGVMGCKCGGMLYKKKVIKKQDGGSMISQKQY